MSARAWRSASKRASTSRVSIPGLMSLEGDTPDQRLALLGEVDQAHAAFAQGREDGVGTELRPRRQRDACLTRETLGLEGRRRRLEKRLRLRLLRQQRFHLAPQRGVVRAGLRQKGRPRLRLALECRLADARNLGPAVTRHGVTPAADPLLMLPVRGILPSAAPPESGQWVSWTGSTTAGWAPVAAPGAQTPFTWPPAPRPPEWPPAGRRCRSRGCALGAWPLRRSQVTSNGTP